MAKYFHYSQGLRGCYMPDNASVIRVNSRRDLKAAIEWDVRDLREAGYVGLSKANVASFVAAAWRAANIKRPPMLPYALPYRDKQQDHAPYGLFLSVATNAEWREYEKECCGD